MTADDVARILETLGAHYNQPITAEQAAAWFEMIERYPTEAGDMALDAVRRNNRFMPNPTEFVNACQVAARELRRRLSTGVCERCGGTQWVDSQSDPGCVLPCDTCNEAGFEQWQRWWADQSARVRRAHLTEDSRLPANPQVGLRSIRETLEDF